MSETLTKCERDVRDDFERRWVEGSPFGGVEHARSCGYRPVPCDCGRSDCCGWRMDADVETVGRRMVEAFASAIPGAVRRAVEGTS